ncbi:MAG: lipoyl domain-containing protein [Dehalococcoidia bacterium]
MAVPVTVPRLGPGDGEALVAEWYQPDGATVAEGDLVYRLETDFAAIDVEADENGVVRHTTAAGTSTPFGEVVAYILSPGEAMPGEEVPPPEPTTVVSEEAPEPPRPATDRAGAYPLADVLRATAATDAAHESPDALPGLPWDAFPAEEPAGGEAFEAPKPVLLFPRIVNELKEEAAIAEEDELDPPLDVTAEATEPAEPGAWELVPGENDFNPDWLLEPGNLTAPETKEEVRTRFQASNIRSLALGRGKGHEEETPSKSETAALVTPDPELPGAVVPTGRALNNLEQLQERRGDYVPGSPLFLRVAIDVTEATKMREQLTREWWGSNVRPLDQDIILRAIARALHESAAFRRRTDVVGVRPLSGTSRTVHLLGDAATRPFRDAVASMAALRETLGAEMPCLCTLTDLGDLGLDDGMPALPGGQPLAFAMGAVRDVARFEGDKPRRASELILTLSYDSDAMPEGAAARLLSRVRELVEAPYALLAD